MTTTRSTPPLPSWIAEREAILGPLFEASARFLAREEADASALPPGLPALRWLARRIDLFAEREASDQEEATFVEGAGALLGAILLQHVGVGHHVSRDGMHRVKLGTHGFFDPFRSIETALAASSASAALVAEVAKAEGEAMNALGHGRVLSGFEKLLADLRPNFTIDECFEGHLWLVSPDRKPNSEEEDPAIEVDATKIVALADGENEGAVDKSIESLISMLPSPDVPLVDREDALSRLVPRVVGPDFDLRDALFAEALPNGTRLCLALAYPGRARFVRAQELEAWGIESREAIDAAIHNLTTRSAKTRAEEIEAEDGSIISLRTGDGFDSARLVLPKILDVLGPELGVPFLAAIPHRDALLACPANAPRAFEAMMARVADDFAHARHRISDKAFRVGPGGIEAL